MGRSRKFNVTGCFSVRRNTSRRCLTSVFIRENLSSPPPFLAVWVPCGLVKPWGTTSATGTGGESSGSWRNTPPRFPNARGVWYRFFHGSLLIKTMSPINSRWGRSERLDGRLCSTYLRQARCRSAWTWSLWIMPRHFHNCYAQLPTTIATGHPYIRILGRRGSGGGWWQRCWLRQ